ncbi:hypothetical protein [Nocardia sp. CDC160]|uniref:hypothetical protein n=1 Tax=Nocardia sp. CDC160 TaxID=3112166 RepID=UPI002DB9A0E7|nr:hypothetical protein [Nocardia sp. CDC160]MEC3920353.1 hypothetical protein [Nocardia sp. CDC160]
MDNLVSVSSEVVLERYEFNRLTNGVVPDIFGTACDKGVAALVGADEDCHT